MRHGNSVPKNPHSIEITDFIDGVLRGKKVELVYASIIRVPSLYKKFHDTTYFILSGIVEARVQLLEEKGKSIFMQFLLLSSKLSLGASEEFTGGTSSSPPLLFLMESLIRKR